EYVTLRYPLGAIMGHMQSRRRVYQESGEDALEKAFKTQANSIYGVLASPHLPVQNVLAANQITARGRAAAFALSQALNAIQTITDGCSFRLDQIPAFTFEECLEHRADYTIRRAEEEDGIPFQDPATIPLGDEAFTAWVRAHLSRFFGMSLEDYDELFGWLQLKLKRTTDGKA